jgi:alpha-L-fucosidase
MNINPKPWSELTDFHTPRWLRDQKFGIYTHWGVYAVGACGPNVSWYPYNMYREGTDQYRYHCEKFGHPSKVGYKDLIPRFNAAKFDPDEWAEIFAGSGAKFAGPVAEHHDGFSMWDSELTKWNAKLMGPKRDISGELEKAYRRAGMKFMASFHHGSNWRFYPHWMKGWDVSNPEYEGLYGELHNTGWDPKTANEMSFWDYDQDLPTIKAQELWLNKIIEFIDKYGPDYIWLENDLEFIGDYYKRAALTYYFNYAASHNKEVVVSYKNHNLPVGAGLYNMERGHFQDLTYFDWICDTTIDSHEGWGYMENATYKTGRRLIHYLLDNVSKNGYLLLNVGPKPNGEIPEEAKIVLKEIGDWLKINGEAVYGTRPWVLSGAGPTVMEVYGEGLDNHDVAYTSGDIRFTEKDNVLYATCLGEIGETVVIPEIGNQFYRTYLGEIESVSLLGDGGELSWEKERPNLVINTAGVKVQKNANVLKIRRKKEDYR